MRLGSGPGSDPGLTFSGRSLSDFPGGSHRVEHAGDDLRRARTARLIAGSRFEQLRVRQDDPELVVQLVEQVAQITVHTWRPFVLASASRAGRAGSRHSVSVKMRIDPPAVRTYSTLPAEIQL